MLKTLSRVLQKVVEEIVRCGKGGGDCGDSGGGDVGGGSECSDGGGTSTDRRLKWRHW